MSYFDIIALLIVTISGLVGFYSGFIRMLIGLFSFIGSLFLSYLLFPVAEIIAQSYFTKAYILTNIAAGVASYLVSLLIFTILGRKLINFVHDLCGGIVDRSLGLILGAFRGLFFVAVIFSFIAIFVSDAYVNVTNAKEMVDKINPQNYPKWIKQSVFCRIITNIFGPEVLDNYYLQELLESIEFTGGALRERINSIATIKELPDNTNEQKQELSGLSVKDDLLEQVTRILNE